MMAGTAIPEGLEAPGRDDAPPAAFASVVDLVLLEVRLRARRRTAWLEHLRQGSGEGGVAAGLDGRDTPESEDAWYASGAVEAESRGLARLAERLAGEAGEPLRRLASLFGLAAPEEALLKSCLAAAADPHLAPVFAHLQRHPARCYPTEALAARLFGYGRRTLWGADSPLAVWGLVTAAAAPPGEPAPLACDRQLLRWLEGTLGVDAGLVDVLTEVERRPPLPSWPVERTVQFLRRAMERGNPARVLLVGPPGCGRRSLAAAVAARFGFPALAVDSGRIADERWPELFMRAQRLALLGGAALVWHGERLDRRWPGHLTAAPLQFLACEEAEVVPSCRGSIDERLELPATTLDERRALWAHEVPESAVWPAAEREALIARHRLTVGDVAALGQRCPASPREASALCRQLTRERLGDLGRLLECPFTWEDLVLPATLRAALEDFAFEARERTAFWESPAARRLFPRGTGLVALLTGPPGTGKTMAAQVVAADLDLDLFRIDLATVVSKYIGETAKNLSRIFTRAARMNAVLLFDEADALFSRRTEVRDAHDRYANTDTNYLLQLLEEYRGIALLATNKKNNLDPAFARRVRYVLDFPRPDAPSRRRIWTRLVGELADEATATSLDDALDAISRAVDASGAQIKNAVLAALFIARRRGAPLAIEHLVSGLERELGKEGRSLGRGERERLARCG